MSEIVVKPVDDNEALARFVLSSSCLDRSTPKTPKLTVKAFWPVPYPEISVYRVDGYKEAAIHDLGRSIADERESNHRAKILKRTGTEPPNRTFDYRGRAHITAKGVRQCGLDVIPDEPPQHHAIFVNWPEVTDVKAVDDERQMKISLCLVAKAQYVPPLAEV